MHAEALIAPAVTGATYDGIAVAIKQEERPTPFEGAGTLCRAVRKMTVREFGNLAISRGARPSAILAGCEIRLAP